MLFQGALLGVEASVAKSVYFSQSLVPRGDIHDLSRERTVQILGVLPFTGMFEGNHACDKDEDLYYFQK